MEDKKHKLEDQNIRRVRECIKNKINYISGTVTPAQSNKYKNAKPTSDNNVINAINVVSAPNVDEHTIGDIECIDIGLKYLFDTYGGKVTLSIQPKYMGSRCNIYLFRDDHLKRSYAVSRNGFLITKVNHKQLESVYETLHVLLLNFMTDNKIKMMIIDGELLPWSVLGKQLIDNEFLPVDKGLETEIEYMKRYDFDTQLQKLKHTYSDISNITNINNINKENNETQETEVNTKKVKEFEKFKDLLTAADTNESQRMYDMFHKQMLLYTECGSVLKSKHSDTLSDIGSNDNTLDTDVLDTDIKIEYKPFGILKLCFEDGSESIPLVDHLFSQSEMFDLLRGETELSRDNIDSQLVLEMSEHNFDENVTKAQEYFNKLTYEHGYEGVVIKPDYVKSKCLPMMKCRNTAYLTIIYGYDYMKDPKLTRLVKSKTTSLKIRQSIKEFNLGMEMLKVKYDDITMDNESYQKTLFSFITNENVGETLDPRL